MNLVTRSRDIDLDGVKCLRLDYSSEIGFSGGPVFLKDSHQIIGMMFMAVPTDDGSFPTQSFAIHIDDIEDLIE